ncbi:MAG: hypothetical protein LBU51_05775 [Bacteroidales bacterium]|jgi:hypothetical protein|nr:hypothetical protein [Bacteroidales bacterium]
MRYQKDIHIGKVIEQVFNEKLLNGEITKKEFAVKIHRCEKIIEDIFKRKSLNTEQLIDIAYALNYDFLSEYYIEAREPENKHIHLKISIINAEIAKINIEK